MDAATLRSVPLFASLDSKATAELGEYLTIHDYPRSATIFRNGDPGEDYPISMENRRDRMPGISVRDVLDRVERWRTNYASAASAPKS